MSRKLLLQLCLLMAAGLVALFYGLHHLTLKTEQQMSMLNQAHRDTITAWGHQAEQLYSQGEISELERYLKQLADSEQTWVSVAKYGVDKVAGQPLETVYTQGHALGRSVDWKIHLYMNYNPVMEVPFANQQASFLIQLPQRMRPGAAWPLVKMLMQVVLPISLLAMLSLLIYRYIMKPLRQLQTATAHFSEGKLDIRARQLMGQRNDEFAELASTFDQMASRISRQLLSQRQLIADLSHELRTPLTRLDIAVDSINTQEAHGIDVERIVRESKQIRRLVEDSLALAWLDNEQPQLQQETLDLVDLIDVLIEDAKFEFPNKQIHCQLPDSASIENSSHRAAGQAIENVLRNALRYTPTGKAVSIKLSKSADHQQISIQDEGPGVPQEHLESIFQPFFRVDQSRETNGDSFGLGLALAQRQIAAIRGHISAMNRPSGGLSITIMLPLS